jgi:predicted Fe-S protein YdhL (DUF1289 family)
MKYLLELDEDGFPMAPSQARWDAMTPEEREWVVAALPGKASDAQRALSEEACPELMEEIRLRKEAERQLAELLGGRWREALRWRRSAGWREYPGVVARRRPANMSRARSARQRTGD